MKIKFQSVNAALFICLMAVTLTVGAGLAVLIFLVLDRAGIPSVEPRRGGRPRETLVGIIAGALLLGLANLFIKRFLAREYELEINDGGVTVSGEKTKLSFNYGEITKLTIWNNSDYAKIVIETQGRNHCYHIGFANMKIWRKNTGKIIESFEEIDRCFGKHYFKKESKNEKGIEKTAYLAGR